MNGIFMLSQKGLGGEHEFVFLTPRICDPAINHWLMGPTYPVSRGIAIIIEIKYYS